MGEMTWTSVCVGGAIPQNLIDELNEIVEEEFSDLEDFDIAETIEAGQSVIFVGNVNYGNPEELLAFCHKHDLPYWHWFESGRGQWSSMIHVWRPGWDEERVVYSNTDYEPLADMKDIAEFGSVAVLLLWLHECKADAVPPLTMGPVKLTESEVTLSSTEGA